MVSPLVRSTFFGQNADFTSGLQCILIPFPSLRFPQHVLAICTTLLSTQRKIKKYAPLSFPLPHKAASGARGNCGKLSYECAYANEWAKYISLQKGARSGKMQL